MQKLLNLFNIIIEFMLRRRFNLSERYSYLKKKRNGKNGENSEVMEPKPIIIIFAHAAYNINGNKSFDPLI